MQITEKTKISELIKENRDSINAIAAIAKPLEKLKNPILRKVMASRVTIAEAAKMAGCGVHDFAKALQPLGFSFSESGDNPNEKTETKPAWLTNAGAEDIVAFDVRGILAGGTDPLKDIMQQYKQVPEGKILCIINSFIPTPLVNLLTKDGKSESYTETMNEKEFHTFFRKGADTKTSSTTREKVIMDNADSFAEIHNRFSQDQLTAIDVRGLEMPGPMHAILGALGEQAPGDALFIHHKRVPVYLLEEIAEKDYEVHIHSLSDTEVKMLIFKPQ